MSEEYGIVQACIADLEDKLKSHPKLKGKVLHVYSTEELLDKTKQITSFPAVGIIYEGMRNNQKEAGDARTPIVSCLLVASVVVMTSSESMLSAKKAETLQFIDEVREAINRTRSPTKHFWVFQVEAPAEVKANRVLWIQRWSTATQI